MVSAQYSFRLLNGCFLPLPTRYVGKQASFLGVFHHFSTFPMLVSVAAAIVVAMIALVRQVGVQGRVQRP
jgi:hypothetical protein